MTTREGARCRHDHADVARAPRFALDVITTEPSVVMVVAGELDIATAPQLRTALVAADGRDVDVDLSALEFIDAHSVGTLAFGAAQCRRGGAHLRVHRPRPFVRRVLALCDLDDLIARGPEDHRTESERS